MYHYSIDASIIITEAKFQQINFQCIAHTIVIITVHKTVYDTVNIRIL